MVLKQSIERRKWSTHCGQKHGHQGQGGGNFRVKSMIYSWLRLLDVNKVWSAGSPTELLVTLHSQVHKVHPWESEHPCCILWTQCQHLSRSYRPQIVSKVLIPKEEDAWHETMLRKLLVGPETKFIAAWAIIYSSQLRFSFCCWCCILPNYLFFSAKSI